MQYKVTFHLMVDPSSGDATFSKSYKVEAADKREAYNKAEAVKDQDAPEFSKRSVFNYSVKEVG